jgi:hypothetical protein
MTLARTSLEHRTPAAGDPDQVTRQHFRTSNLFDKNHAYAARLVQIATAIRSVVRSTITMNMPDQVPSEIQEDDGITAGIVTQSQAHRSGGP